MIPSVDILEMISEYYFNHDKKDLIEKLLMSIDYSNLDFDRLKAFCIQRRLEIALIFICTKDHRKFKVPIDALA